MSSRINFGYILGVFILMMLTSCSSKTANYYVEDIETRVLGSKKIPLDKIERLTKFALQDQSNFDLSSLVGQGLDVKKIEPVKSSVTIPVKDYKHWIKWDEENSWWIIHNKNGEYTSKYNKYKGDAIKELNTKSEHPFFRFGEFMFVLDQNQYIDRIDNEGPLFPYHGKGKRFSNISGGGYANWPQYAQHIALLKPLTLEPNKVYISSSVRPHQGRNEWSTLSFERFLIGTYNIEGIDTAVIGESMNEHLYGELYQNRTFHRIYLLNKSFGFACYSLSDGRVLKRVRVTIDKKVMFTASIPTAFYQFADGTNFSDNKADNGNNVIEASEKARVKQMVSANEESLEKYLNRIRRVSGSNIEITLHYNSPHGIIVIHEDSIGPLRTEE